jgi:hypothetical protein
MSFRSDLRLRSEEAGRALLIGGEPFDEQIVMWWNFIGRDHDEIVAAREEWMSGRRSAALPVTRCPRRRCPRPGSSRAGGNGDMVCHRRQRAPTRKAPARGGHMTRRG